MGRGGEECVLERFSTIRGSIMVRYMYIQVLEHILKYDIDIYNYSSPVIVFLSLTSEGLEILCSIISN